MLGIIHILFVKDVILKDIIKNITYIRCRLYFIVYYIYNIMKGDFYMKDMKENEDTDNLLNRTVIIFSILLLVICLGSMFLSFFPKEKNPINYSILKNDFLIEVQKNGDLIVTETYTLNCNKDFNIFYKETDRRYISSEEILEARINNEITTNFRNDSTKMTKKFLWKIDNLTQEQNTFSLKYRVKSVVKSYKDKSAFMYAIDGNNFSWKDNLRITIISPNEKPVKIDFKEKYVTYEGNKTIVEKEIHFGNIFNKYVIDENLNMTEKFSDCNYFFEKHDILTEIIFYIMELIVDYVIRILLCFKIYKINSKDRLN